MRILLVLPRPLVPADMGAKIRSLHMFSRLAQRHTTNCLCLVPNGTPATVVNQTAQLFNKFVPVYWRDIPAFSPSFYWEYLKAQPSGHPYALYRYCLPALQQALRQQLATTAVDVLLFDFLHPAVNMPASVPCATALFTHNVESQIFRRRIDNENHPIRNKLLQREYRKMWEAEASLCKRFDLVVAVSKQDRAKFEREFRVPNVREVPTGVDTDYFSPVSGPGKQFNLVFVGAMDWYPNEDAVVHFLREVYPQVRAQLPNVSLTIVGRNPTRRVFQLGHNHPDVEITGWVEDVRPYVARADCCIVPLRIGGGTRIKIFEAMAMAKPVVSTTIGVEGLPLMPGQDLLVADEPVAFGDTVVRLLSEPALARRLGERARQVVCQKFGWGKAVDLLEKYLTELTAMRLLESRQEICLGATQ